jgi:hypothetical protein
MVLPEPCEGAQAKPGGLPYPNDPDTLGKHLDGDGGLFGFLRLDLDRGGGGLLGDGFRKLPLEAAAICVFVFFFHDLEPIEVGEVGLVSPCGASLPSGCPVRRCRLRWLRRCSDTR